MSLFISDVEVRAKRCSVLVDDGIVVAMGADLKRPSGADHIDGNEGMLLPGLHDHHTHLLSTAAATRSTKVGPQDVRSLDDLRRVLLDAANGSDGAWIRAVGYHESVAGSLDRHVLDLMIPGNPVRIQHRSGAVWFLNSLGLDRSGLTASAGSFAERDVRGQLTGRLWRGDHLFGTGEAINVDDLRALSDTASHFGVTGFTDATPQLDPGRFDILTSAHRSGAIRQRLRLMSGPNLAVQLEPDADVGPVKIILDDVDLPGLDDLVTMISSAHRMGRPAAIHCVTDVQTVLALSAINIAGPNGGDRIEHGSIMPPEFDKLARTGVVTVITQPHFIAERGDDYLRDVPEHQHDSLYRARTLIESGISLAGGTDAPFGASDPWIAITAATRRCAESGTVIGPQERLTPLQALNLFTGEAYAPGIQRRIQVGAFADFCLLSLNTKSALEDLSSENVRATIIDGLVVFEH